MAGTASPSTFGFDAPVTSSRPAVPRRAVPAVGRRRGVRLTRRGRLLLLLALLALLLAAFTLGRVGDSQAATSAATPTATRPTYVSTTVHQGETLWAVAKRVDPGHDPRALVQAIRQLNHLQSAAVQAGQQLLLPRQA